MPPPSEIPEPKPKKRILMIIDKKSSFDKNSNKSKIKFDLMSFVREEFNRTQEQELKMSASENSWSQFGTSMSNESESKPKKQIVLKIDKIKTRKDPLRQLCMMHSS